MRRVLVADDDDAIRAVVKVALRRMGYEVAEATDGREALHAMREAPPDLLMLDLMMPYVSGYDVLRERSEDPLLRAIPVIVVSAVQNDDLHAVAVRWDCPVLSKPFDVRRLGSVLEAALSRQLKADRAAIPGGR